jgi:hypothetical protein
MINSLWAKILLVFVLVLLLNSCKRETEPTQTPSYTLKLTVLGGDPNVPQNHADTIIFQINDSLRTFNNVLLPWTYDSKINIGDSISLRAFDPRSDCCPTPPNGNGYATFVRIEIYANSSLGECCAMGRNIPSLDGEWLHTALRVNAVIIEHNLSLPPELKSVCEPMF